MFLVFLAACSSEKETSKQVDDVSNMEEIVALETSVRLNKVYSWINLMPGPNAQPTFHITGEIELHDSKNYETDKMKLVQIVIYQNDIKIYSIEPGVREDENLSTEGMRLLIFSNPQKILVDERLDSEKSVDAFFVFEYDSDMYSYILKNIKIDKAF